MADCSCNGRGWFAEAGCCGNGSMNGCCGEPTCIRVPCEECQREGRVYRRNGNCPDELDCGLCSACEGSCYVMVPTEPMTFDDMEDAFGF